MAQVDRFSVSLDTELLAAFDRHIGDRGYGNRSEAIRDLIRDLLVAGRLPDQREPVVAILTVIVDHRDGDPMKRLRTIRDADSGVVIGSFEVAVDEYRDSVAIGMRGPAGDVQTAADRIRALKGIRNGHLWAVPIHDRALVESR